MSESTIACLLVTRLPVKAERQRYPALRGKPLVISETRGSRDLVLDSSPEARGVSAGMPIPEALARCPQATLLPADTQFYSEVSGRLTDMLAMRCPVAEAAEPGCVYAWLEELSLTYGGEARFIASLLQAAPPEFSPRLGLASVRFAAYVAAATAPTGRAIKAPPDQAAFLSGHSVELLPLSREGRERLRRAGIHTLGQLAALPAAAAQARLGAEGRRAWELAQGTDRGPMRESEPAAA